VETRAELNLQNSGKWGPTEFLGDLIHFLGQQTSEAEFSKFYSMISLKLCTPTDFPCYFATKEKTGGHKLNLAPLPSSKLPTIFTNYGKCP